MRNQWGVFDAPLYELEYARQFDKPVRPLPVTISERQSVHRRIATVADVKEAMAHYYRAIKALADRIARGQYTLDGAVETAKKLLHETPRRLLGLYC